MAEYKPGVCNIGKNEIRKRYAFGAAGLALFAVLVYLLLSLSMPKIYLLSAFVPLVLAFEGIYQGYFGFCVGYASRGIYDLEGSGGGYGKVADTGSHKADMARANTITMYAVASALVVAIAVYVLLR